MTTARVASQTILFDYPEPMFLDDMPLHVGRKRAADLESRTHRLHNTHSDQADNCATGRCLRACDPLGTGRALVAYCDAEGDEYRGWLRALDGLWVQQGDEVLLLQPRGSQEPIVAGILSRGPASGQRARQIVLQESEPLTVTAANGQKLMEIAQGEQGPIVRLCHDDVAVDLPGKLRLSAAGIELHSQQGPVHIESGDDVVVRGAVIRLN